MLFSVKQFALCEHTVGKTNFDSVKKEQTAIAIFGEMTEFYAELNSFGRRLALECREKLYETSQQMSTSKTALSMLRIPASKSLEM